MKVQYLSAMGVLEFGLCFTFGQCFRGQGVASSGAVNKHERLIDRDPDSIIQRQVLPLRLGTRMKGEKQTKYISLCRLEEMIDSWMKGKDPCHGFYLIGDMQASKCIGS